MKPAHRFLVLLLVSFAGSFFTAILFTIVLRLSLPPSDLAYRQPLSQTFSDPFVRVVMIEGAVVAGIVAFPVIYFCLRRRNLAVALPIVFGSVALSVVVITPFSIPAGLLASFAALFASSLYCTYSQRASLAL
jgi:hypothetical protein